MEGLILRTYALGGGLLLAGAIVSVSDVARSKKSEHWMEKEAPAVIRNVHFTPSEKNPEQSYRMDESTYSMLHPFGIVCRNYDIGGTSFDVVLIASSSKDSFHDPRVCFSGQGYQLDNLGSISLPTKTRGTIRATYSELNSTRGSAQTIFFYRGPYGFAPTTLELKMDIFKHEISTGQNTDGVFYRFISEKGKDPVASKAALASFVADYMDNAGQASNGYF